MAKGVHSKRRKRNQRVKRNILEKELWGPTLEATSKRLFKRTFGMGDDSEKTRQKNAFRYPKDPEAIIPQAKAPLYIDKRTSAAPIEFLMKEMGYKRKNVIKKENLEHLNNALRQAELRAEGKERENEVIDMNTLVNLDEFGNIDMGATEAVPLKTIDNSVKRKRSDQMDMDLEDKNVNQPKRGNKKKKKKTKSHYIVNY